jgi:hypothetical protein
VERPACDRSTLEGEYEATISAGTLTGTGHDVAVPSSHATWTATGGPTKTCAGATAMPTSSATSTTLNEGQVQSAILEALVNPPSSRTVIMGPLSLDGGTSMRAAFEKLFPKIDPEASGEVFRAGVLASQDGKDGNPTFPGVRACMPIILRMHTTGSPTRILPPVHQR